MARLLTRLLDPVNGVIRLSQVDTRRLTLATLRSHIGFVTQEVQLFHATVRENITFFNPEIGDDAVLSVITRLGLSDWLAHLPEGLDTVLQGSGGLSAGESQLVAFARVFLSDPGLIVMDEASSRLDPATEQWMERAVSQLLAGRTGILIAHRLATLERVDDVLILEEGRIVEYGSRGDLADDVTSRYHALLHTGLTEVLA
jgi:ABC-type multidrug transport system fused ATPase/permease subunit